jgi:hypothetical protein
MGGGEIDFVQMPDFVLGKFKIFKKNRKGKRKRKRKKKEKRKTYT